MEEEILFDSFEAHLDAEDDDEALKQSFLSE
jgi:hypothetical protein